MVVVSFAAAQHSSTSRICALHLLFWSYVRGTVVDVDGNNDTGVDEIFLKTISHHYCDRLTGTHVMLLADESAAPFYKVLRRSGHFTRAKQFLKNYCEIIEWMGGNIRAMCVCIRDNR